MADSDRRSWTGATDLPVKRWILLTGSRTTLTGVLAIALAIVTSVLVFTGVVYVGPGSNLATVLASGTLGGLATIVTITLSINQLILSRVFGAPADLTDQLEGNLDFRRSIEDIANVNASPNDPGSFLSLVAQTLESRAASFERVVESAGDIEGVSSEEVQDLTASLVDYASHLDSGKTRDSTYEVLTLTFGTAYADHIDDVRRINRATDDLPEEAADDLTAVLELLKGVATVRQFFKTLAVQQDLARLSRHLIYTGIPAILTAFFLAQVYVSSQLAPSVPPSLLPWVVCLATPVIFSPLLLLVSYILRVATVTLYTVSVGSFIPPEERVGHP